MGVSSSCSDDSVHSAWHAPYHSTNVFLPNVSSSAEELLSTVAVFLEGDICLEHVFLDYPIRVLLGSGQDYMKAIQETRYQLHPKNLTHIEQCAIEHYLA